MHLAIAAFIGAVGLAVAGWRISGDTSHNAPSTTRANLIPIHFDHGAYSEGSSWTAVLIQFHQVSERTLSGSASNSVRNSSTAITLSSRVAYTFPSIARRTS